MGEGPRGRAGGRLARLRKTARRSPFLTLVAANVVPIAIAVALAVAWWRGSISFVPAAKNVIPSLIALGISIGLLALLAWIAAPVVFAAMRGAWGIVERQRSAAARGGLAGRIVRAPILVAAILAYAVLWLNALLVGLLVASGMLAVVVSFVAFVAEVWRARV